MKNQKILETVADIAYQAGHQNLYSGNSRADISEFILWAIEFEKININTNWDSTDYLIEIEEYTSMKIRDFVNHVQTTQK